MTKTKHSKKKDLTKQPTTRKGTYHCSYCGTNYKKEPHYCE